MLSRLLAVLVGVAISSSWAHSADRRSEPFATVQTAASQVQKPAQAAPSGPNQIRSALANEKTTLEFVEIPVKDVIDYIRDRHHLEIQFDKSGLKEVGLDPEALPVSINIHDVPLRSALNLILSENQMGYLIENDVMIITSKGKVQSTVVGRIYDVHDLVPNGPEAAKAMSDLADIITNVPSWNSSSGNGSIKPFNHLGVSVFSISQNADAHAEIENTLSLIRSHLPQKSR